MGSILAIAGIVIVGVVIGVVVSKNNNLAAKSGSSSNSSSSSSSSPSPDNPNDPSNFSKNPAFHQSFYGMAYTPANSQLPNCGNSLCKFFFLFCPIAINVLCVLQLLLLRICKYVFLYFSFRHLHYDLFFWLSRSCLNWPRWVVNFGRVIVSIWTDLFLF